MGTWAVHSFRVYVQWALSGSMVPGLGPWDPAWKPGRTWPPKRFTKDEENNKRWRRQLFVGDLLPLQCSFPRNEQGRFYFLKHVCWSPSLFLTQKKKKKERNRCKQSGKVFVGLHGWVTTMCLETHALRREGDGRAQEELPALRNTPKNIYIFFASFSHDFLYCPDCD